MNEEEILKKWKNYFSKQSKIIRKLNKIKPKNLADDFFKPFMVFNEFIYGQLGIGIGKFNELTMKAIAKNFVNLLKKSNVELKNISILLAHNGSMESKFLIEQFSYVLIQDTIKTFFYNENKPINFALFQKNIKTLNFSGAIFFGVSSSNDKFRKMSFYKSDGKLLVFDVLKRLIEFDQKKFFNIEKQIRHSSWLDQKILMKEYFAKLIQLKTRIEDEKLLLVGVLNSSESSSNIIKKILGNLDIEYKSISEKKNFVSNYLLAKNEDSNFTFFEQRKIHKLGLDLLIKPSKSGKTFFLLGNNNGNPFEIDFEILNIIFLNFELEKKMQANEDISFKTIITDFKISSKIQKLVNKFGIQYLEDFDFQNNFSKYKDIDFYYFNSENQILYDKSLANIPDIFQVVLKFIEILNYYKTQRLDIGDVFANMNLMYGNTKVFKDTIACHADHLLLILRNLKQDSLEELRITKVDVLHQKNNSFISKIAYLEINEIEKAYIFYNYLTKKAELISNEANFSSANVMNYLSKYIKSKLKSIAFEK